jgi:hypothetical protein
MPISRLCRRLARRRRLNRQGVHAAREFLRQGGIDQAVTLDSALPSKGGSDDLNAEMRLAAGQRAGMADMEMRFVTNVEALGCKSLSQLVLDARFDRHDAATFFGETHLP